MMKTESIDCDSRADTICQKCFLIGIKQIHLTDDNRESHELLHKQHAQVLLFNLDNAQSMDLRKEKDSDLIEDIIDNDEDRDRIHKESDIQCIDVQEEIAVDQYPAQTKDVVAKQSKSDLRKKVVSRNTDVKLRKQSLARSFVKNFDDATIQLLKEGIERCRQQDPQRLGFSCQVCFVSVEQNHPRAIPWCGLLDHARIHIGKLWFRCPLCSYESATKRQMKSHKYGQHFGCTDANLKMIERKMERGELEELRLAMMLCVGCKRSDSTVVGNSEENEVVKTTKLQSGSRSESKSGDAEQKAYVDDTNVSKIGQNRCSLKYQRLSMCRKLLCQNPAADGRSICQICKEQNIRASFSFRSAYNHVNHHAKLLIYKCNICSKSLRKRRSMSAHIYRKHQKPSINNYTNRSDEFHSEIVTWMKKCFGSDKNRA